MTKPIQSVRDLMVGKSEEEMFEAEQNMRRYLMLVGDICDRVTEEEEARERGEEINPYAFRFKDNWPESWKKDGDI